MNIQERLHFEISKKPREGDKGNPAKHGKMTSATSILVNHRTSGMIAKHLPNPNPETKPKTSPESCLAAMRFSR